MAQEKIGNEWMQQAKDYAKAEKELKIDKWVIITYYRIKENGGHEAIFKYDLPRDIWQKWIWVINWRGAFLTCKYPRGGVFNTLYFYDKHSGESLDITGCLNRLISAKAQVTKVQRAIANYVAWNRENNMFFDETTDEQLVFTRKKLAVKIANVEEAEERLKLKVERRQNEQRKL